MELELMSNNRPFPELFNLKENYDVSGVGGLLNTKIMATMKTMRENKAEDEV